MSEASGVKISDVRFDPPLRADDRYRDVDVAVDDGLVEQLLDEARLEVSRLLVEPFANVAGGSPAGILEALSSCGIAVPESMHDAAHDRDILEKLASCVTSGRRVEFVLSLFPCKGCHPLRTLANRGSELDFGDVKCLVRLVGLVAAVRRVHRPGAHITILSNGRRYSDVFFEHESDVDLYRSNLRELIRFLGCGDVIRLEAEELLYTEEYRSGIATEQERSEAEIRESPADFMPMIADIQLNLNPPLRLSPKDYAEVIRRLGEESGRELNDAQREVLAFIRDNAISATARYVATNKVLRSLRLFENAFQSHIKLTVHAKPGQIAIVPVASDSAFPHNGQAYLHSRPALDNVAVEYAANLLRMEDGQLKGAVLPRRRFPFASDRHPFLVWAQGSRSP
jgi:pyoverdine/dityrosine biosynthesis protein Dit1